MSLHVLANHMAAKGRGPDSMLVHMTPHEVAGLQALAMKHGGSLTINPETGLPEAGFLSSILPIVAGAFLGPAGFGIAESALGAAAMVGGATGLATGSLSKGLMAGLGAYGGYDIGKGLVGLGTAINPQALAAANASGDAIGALANTVTPASGFDAAYQGAQNAFANPKDLITQMGGTKPALTSLAAAAAPVIADQMVPTTTKAPPFNPGYIRPYDYDPRTQQYTQLTPIKAGFNSGGMVAFADGGDTKEDPYAKYNTLSGQSKAAYDYLMGNTSRSSVPVAPTTPTTPFTPVTSVSTVKPTTPVVPETPIVTTPTVTTPTVTTPTVTTPTVTTPTVTTPTVTTPTVTTPTVTTPTVTTGTTTTGTTGTTGTTPTTTTGPSGPGITTLVPGTGSTTPGDGGTGTVAGPGGPSTVPTTTTAPGITTLLPGAGGTATTPTTTTTTPATTTTTPATTTTTATSGGSGGGEGGLPSLTGSSGLSIPITPSTPVTSTPVTSTPVTSTPITPTTPSPVEVATPTTPSPTEVLTPSEISTPTEVTTPSEPSTVDTGVAGSGQGGSSTSTPDTTSGTTGQGTDFTPATDLGNGLFGVDQPDGTTTIITEDGHVVGSAPTVTSPESWEGNTADKVGVPNVNIQGGNETTGGVNEFYTYPELGGISGTKGGGKSVFDESLGTVEMAYGGMTGYAMGGGLGSLGGYSDGGRLLRGPGDGISDSIPATIGRKQQPARLADGEFVIPARIVSELGNGSTDAGARKLYAMMDRVQKARGKTVGKGKVAANSRADKHLPA